jgi:methyl-accepting chemotaxis protein
MKLSTKQLIDSIAKLYPDDIAAEYYREMMYCCSLPENDEMLRILRILQILTALMEGIPSRVMVEREALERLFSETASDLKAVLSSSESFQKQLDLRLSLLPAAIAEGIQPEDIARTINESLQQQFDSSTIPQTAKALTLVAEQIRTVHSEFSSAASKIGNSYRGAAEEAREAIERMHTTIENSARIARSASADLSVKFKSAYWKVLISAAVGALLAGFVIGASYVRNFDPPKQEIIKYYVESKCPDPPVKPKRK